MSNFLASSFCHYVFLDYFLSGNLLPFYPLNSHAFSLYTYIYSHTFSFQDNNWRKMIPALLVLSFFYIYYLVVRHYKTLKCDFLSWSSEGKHLNLLTDIGPLSTSKVKCHELPCDRRQSLQLTQSWKGTVKSKELLFKGIINFSSYFIM